MILKSIVDDIKIEMTKAEGWSLSHRSILESEYVEVIHFDLNSDVKRQAPQLCLEFGIPQHDIQTKWSAGERFSCILPPDWRSNTTSNLASNLPLVSFLNFKGENRLTFAVSEAKRAVIFAGGVNEYSKNINCKISLFTAPEAPFQAYSFELRIDRTPCFYAKAIDSVTKWFEQFEDYRPAAVPDAALDAVYSTWYSFHQEFTAQELEEQCQIAKNYGIKSIIVDDGWQTDKPGVYSYCGDWEVSPKRIDNMKEHVQRVHAMGMKYILWYSVPFVGYKSNLFKKFENMCITDVPNLGTKVLDPRFPEVREYLITTYEKALLEWDIDGFKLDFIDSFNFVDNFDPAVAEDYANRDIKSLPEAVDLLLTETMKRLRKIKPDILIEFRQSYIGPAIRKYCNMFRAGDCPSDINSNRLRTIYLRLTSGFTAVHSDMLAWHSDEKVEIAALQLVHVLFSVPQISIKFNEIPISHQQMLHFYLDFWYQHRDTLLFGELRPYNPELNYPIVYATAAQEEVIGVYNSHQIVKIAANAPQCSFVVNGTTSTELYIDCQKEVKKVVAYDCVGNIQPDVSLKQGLNKVQIPVSGILKITTLAKYAGYSSLTFC